MTSKLRPIIAVALIALVAIIVVVVTSHKAAAPAPKATASSDSAAFQQVSYTNSAGTQYQFDFYSKHGTQKLKSGNTQLVSSVEKGGKFPLAVSISSGEASGYDQVKNCAGYKKVFDVQNSHLDQKIAVCDILAGQKSGGQDAGGRVYVAGFLQDNKAHIITIGQDYAGVDTSSQSAARAAAAKFGLAPYQADIQRIIASVTVVPAAADI